jgi:hypothetical protein
MLWFLIFIVALAVLSLLLAPDSRDRRVSPSGSWAPLTVALSGRA